MKKNIIAVFSVLLATASFAQNKMTPELLWQLGRVSGLGISKDGKYVLYRVSTPNIDEDKSLRQVYAIAVNGGEPVRVSNPDSLLVNEKKSPDGKYMIGSEEVKVLKVAGKELYPTLTKSNVNVYDNLNYRHWDTYEDGKFDHVLLTPIVDGKKGTPIDIMKDEPYDCPQKPSGGDEDFIWHPNGKEIVYCTKKKFGTAYAVSTNTDLYSYNIETGKTINLTETNLGYDINPQFNKDGRMAWLRMKRDGFEADKQDLMVSKGSDPYTTINLTSGKDYIHVESFKWSNDGQKIYFIAPVDGTLQLFETNASTVAGSSAVKQITQGVFDINAIIGQSGNNLIVSRTDMNHAAELYSVDNTTGIMTQLTHVNDAVYKTIGMSKTERRFVKTTDGKNMLVWMIYPPDFDATKKYPTLLYCQGGPQSPLTQFYSFRWNFQLMAAKGYVVVAPCRRGMPGFGTQWNEDISKDHGGQAIKDLLSAMDDVSTEKYVDKSRLGCIGASYGGYAVYMIAGLHNNRFKTFIAHDGIFDLKSMYGTTEELWFVNWDYGGAYWDKKNAAAQKTYEQFSPSNFADKWNTPILIYQGGKDYRVPIEQAEQAFQAAQLRGIKSRYVLLHNQNHWVSTPQDALVWQNEFYKWLDETLK